MSSGGATASGGCGIVRSRAGWNRRPPNLAAVTAADPDVFAEQLRPWLAARGRASGAITVLAGDVSARRYARVELAGGATAIAAGYPSDLAAAQRRFEGAARLLAAAGVRVPATLDCDPEAGLTLVEDLGERTLYDLGGLEWPELEPWFEAAVDLLARVRRLEPGAVAALGSPPLDEALLARELAQTERLYLRPRGLVDDGSDGRRFLAALSELCARLGAEPPVPCHRDFMARNLVPLGGGELAVLDFQDLRLGPPGYDLASLLNDSLFPPPAVEARLLARATGSAAPSESYLRAAAQRALKAVGTFAAFAARGNPRHLPLVAPTLARAAAALERLPETAAAFERLAGRFRAELPRGSDLLD